MSSSRITLTAADGFNSSAYVAEPSATPRGAVVVLQEIFGVNSPSALSPTATRRPATSRSRRRRSTASSATSSSATPPTNDPWVAPQGCGRGAAGAGGAARHPGCGRPCRQGRQGRHRRLLLGRPPGLALCRKSSRPVGGGRLLWRRHDGRQRAVAQARGADDGAFRRPGCAHLGREREGLQRAIRKPRSTSTRPTTASTAISAAPTAPAPPRPRWNARRTTSASTSDRPRRRAPAVARGRERCRSGRGSRQPRATRLEVSGDEVPLPIEAVNQ